MAPPTFLLGVGMYGFFATRRVSTLGGAWIFAASLIVLFAGGCGRADRAEGKFVAVKRRPLIPVPSSLSDSTHLLQRPKGTGDVSEQEAHTTDAPLEGLRERPTFGEQACEYAEHEDVWTLFT